MTPKLSTKVSVVVPAFNAAATIGQAIASVLCQTMQDVEVVVCDDASTDGTCEVVRSFGDGRVRLLHNTTRLGAGESRNVAIEAVSGEWISVLDADDAFHPMRLERMLRAAGQDDRTMVFDDILECRHTDMGLVPLRRLRGRRAFGANGAAVEIDPSDWIRTDRLLIKPMFNSHFIRAHGLRHTSRGYAEDTEYFLGLAGAGARLKYLPEPLYYYRKTPGSASSSPHRHRDMLEVLGSAQALFHESPKAADALARRIEHERRMEHYFELIGSLKRGDFRKAARISLTRPGVLKELLLRSGKELPYHLYPGKTRIIHGTQK